MAIEINWSVEAEETFNQTVDYILQNWSEKEAENFVGQTNKVLERLKLFPESYPPGLKNRKYRRAKLNKYIVLFYRYYKSKKTVTLVAFWNSRQDPQKLKF